MDLGKFLETLVRNGRLLGRIMLGIMAALVIADILIPTGYGRFPWDGIGGIGALYGLLSCVIIVVVSKALGYQLLYRPEDYYGEESRPNPFAAPDDSAGDRRHD